MLTLWMDGASNQKIAAHLSINGKTVYTYKRNIRMKTAYGYAFFSVLIPAGIRKADGTVSLVSYRMLITAEFSCRTRDCATTFRNILTDATRGITGR